MRGSLSLFTDIFEQPVTPGPEVRRKGRSPELHAKRNECLIDRYYYYGKFMDRRYESIIKTLSEEFFISPVTIPEVIAENSSLLLNLKKNQPSKNWFSKKWPHLSW